MNDIVWYLMIWMAVTVPGALLGWILVFRKAGMPGWAAIVPLYNIYVMVVHVARLSRLWFLLVLTPGVQVIAVLLVNVKVAERFGRSEAYGLGLCLLGFVFYPALGFGKARYQQ